MTLDPLSLLIGAGAAGVAALWWAMTDRGGGGAERAAGGSYGAGPTLHGQIVPGHVGSPSGPLIPQPGYASREDYEWGYVVGPGDSVEGIAQAVTGDEGRYQELLLANPQLKMVGDAGVWLGDKAWGVAPGQMLAGESLLLPVPWSRYVDQLGRARGAAVPFPTDPRAATDVLVAGARELGDGGQRQFVPYDRPVEIGAAA